MIVIKFRELYLLLLCNSTNYLFNCTTSTSHSYIRYIENLLNCKATNHTFTCQHELFLEVQQQITPCCYACKCFESSLQCHSRTTCIKLMCLSFTALVNVSKKGRNTIQYNNNNKPNTDTKHKDKVTPTHNLSFSCYSQVFQLFMYHMSRKSLVRSTHPQ